MELSNLLHLHNDKCDCTSTLCIYVFIVYSTKSKVDNEQKYMKKEL